MYLAELQPRELGKKASRQIRRLLDRGSMSGVPDTSRVETRMVNALCARAALGLGLTCRFIGEEFLSIEDERGPLLRLRGAYTDLDSFASGEVCGDKMLSRIVLAAAGLSIPRGEGFARSREREALAFARSLQRPCVTKPARGTAGSVGVSVALGTRRSVQRGFRRAALYSSDVLVEEHVPGGHYRLLVFKGRCLSVLRREPPAVIGDGRSAVFTLVARENARRSSSFDDWHVGDPELMPLVLNARARACLKEQGFTRASVPAAGRLVRLSKLANFAVGASYWECIRATHPQLVQAAERAARAAGVVLAGVDLIAPDVAGPTHAINEINTTPSIELHYFAANRADRVDPFSIILADLMADDHASRRPSFVAGAAHLPVLR